MSSTRARAREARPLALAAAVALLVPVALTARTADAATRWHAASPAAFAKRLESVTAISCAVARGCVATATRRSGSTTTALALVEERGSWRAVALPVPRGFSLTLGAISCAAPGACTAVGSLVPGTSSQGSRLGAIVTERAGHWTTSVATMPSALLGTSVTLHSISCTTATSCEAVGTATLPFTPSSVGRGAAPTAAVVAEESGGLWSAFVAPAPPEEGGDLSLQDVACVAALSCTAVGTYLAAGGHQEGLVVTSESGALSSSTTPLPEGGDAVDSLNGVACDAVAACTAVGAFDHRGTPESLILTEVASRWQAARGPDPFNANALYDIACPALDSCVAVGAELSATYAQEGIVLREVRGRWRVLGAPLPPRANASPPAGFGMTLDGVACTGATSCEAVGTYASSATDLSGVLLAEGADA